MRKAIYSRGSILSNTLFYFTLHTPQLKLKPSTTLHLKHLTCDTSRLLQTMRTDWVATAKGCCVLGSGVIQIRAVGPTNNWPSRGPHLRLVLVVVMVLTPLWFLVRIVDILKASQGCRSPRPRRRSLIRAMATGEFGWSPATVLLVARRWNVRRWGH